MVRPLPVAVVAFLLAQSTYASDVNEDLKRQVEHLSKQLRMLQEQVNKLPSGEDARDRSAADASRNRPEGASLVDLNAEQHLSIDDQDDDHVLSNPWWRNFDISGFAAFGYYDTGSAGTRDNGGFEIKETSLFVTADVWDNAQFFLELQTNRLGKDEEKFTRTGEVYAHFHDIRLSDSITIGMKIGRIDIPFGEEYLWQDAIDNPLITNSAPYPYGWDEGVLVYGEFLGVDWIAAITDGTDARSEDENADKAFNLKLSGNPIEALNLSLSLMANGDASKSAIEFGGSHFRPVGAAHQSSLGTSSSTEVNANLIEINARYDFAYSLHGPALALSFGAADTEDNNPTFDRDFRWFSVEPSFRFRPNWYTTVRYSEIGTYDNTAGYHFDGKTFAGGNAAFGYDAKRFQRLALGIGWTPNPRVRAKLEIAKDRFELVDGSPAPANNSDRLFSGLEIAVGF